MPHVIIELLAGRSEAQKARIAADVAKAVMAGAACEGSAVSVGIEDLPADRWTEEVYGPDIAGKWGTLLKKPGYGPRTGT